MKKILFTLLCTCLIFISNNVFAQKPTVEKVKSVLKDGAKFTDEDFASLEKGEIIVKELETKVNGEVAFCGVILLDAPRDTVFDAFRRAVEKQRKGLSGERGYFSKPPTIANLKKLTIDRSDIGSLKDCKDGDCDWSLSTEFIKRISDEIDWTASDANEKASELIKKIMVENLANYLQNGDAGLMNYNDDPEPLSLADEQKSLLEGLLWINDFAPEFKEYLNNFPNGKLNGVEDLASWEKIQVGFKTVIINSHGIFYKNSDNEIPQGLILSKQIYANHYFHSSQGLTGIISFPQPDKKNFKTYLFFVNHSRAGALTGTMGKLARSAVDGEAENKLTAVLKDTKKFTAYDLGDKEALNEENEGGIKKFLAKYFYLFLIIIVAIIIISAVFFIRRSK